MRLVRIALFAAALGVLAACGGSSPDGAKSPESDKASADDEGEVSSKGKKWGGWRWKGRRNDCFFLYENECFSSLEKACRRAKCDKDACEHDDSAPAKVRCKGADKKEKKDD